MSKCVLVEFQIQQQSLKKIVKFQSSLEASDLQILQNAFFGSLDGNTLKNFSSHIDDTSRVLFEIYNTDFDDWVIAEETQIIEDKSKLRAIFLDQDNDQTRSRESTGAFKRKGVQSGSVPYIIIFSTHTVIYYTVLKASLLAYMQ